MPIGAPMGDCMRGFMAPIIGLPAMAPIIAAMASMGLPIGVPMAAMGSTGGMAPEEAAFSAAFLRNAAGTLISCLVPLPRSKRGILSLSQ